MTSALRLTAPRLSALLIACAVFPAYMWEREVLWNTLHGGQAVSFGLLLAVAVGSYRVLPSLGLAGIWVLGYVQIVTETAVGYSFLALALTLFGAARYGKSLTVWLSGLSIPLAAIFVSWYFSSDILRLRETLDVFTTSTPFIWLSQKFSISMLSLSTLALTVSAGPWLAGMILRMRASAAAAGLEREAAWAEAARVAEIAELRAEQARLARDVHDVVGHSLTVILAQADSAQFMPDSDIDEIRNTIANISKSARKSLGDVRQVLTATGDTKLTEGNLGELATLVDGVRAAGNEVLDRISGTPRPLPPELDAVAFRVLQEMLTNALKHGQRGATIEVELSWGLDELRIEVRNALVENVEDAPDGIGVSGMQRRLKSVGGHLEVGPSTSLSGQVYIATAWIPTRAEVTS